VACCEHGNELLGLENEGNFMTSWGAVSFWRETLLNGIMYMKCMFI